MVVKEYFRWYFSETEKTAQYFTKVVRLMNSTTGTR